jgi:hypothetical protein
MHLLPILPVVLAASENYEHKARAVQLYALAKTLPFVANSKLFEDIAECKLKASVVNLSMDVILSAQNRGQALDIWETAVVLLDELRELGWSES